jgi:hypothetical protein
MQLELSDAGRDPVKNGNTNYMSQPLITVATA